MALKPTRLGTNGSGARKCTSWIDSFIAYTDNLESAEIYRRWAAIATIAAALEQKVWLHTHSPLYPNLYTFLVGHPGVGKSSVIGFARAFLAEIPGFHIAPTSMTGAAMVKAMEGSKCTLVDMTRPAGEQQVNYYSMTLIPDEWRTFINSFKENDAIPLLTTFYDVNSPYEKMRTTDNVHIVLKRPQLSIIAGVTPSDLLDFIPHVAWNQGFTSRLILVFCREHGMVDDFNSPRRAMPEGMIHDINRIHALDGPFTWSQEFALAVDAWRKGGEQPRPTHPKLEHYCARRKAHIYKLAMISAIDRGNELRLELEDFQRALLWLGEVEIYMPAIFGEGISTPDLGAMDEVVDWLRRQGKPVHHARLLNQVIRAGTPLTSVHRVMELLYQTGRVVKNEKNYYLVAED